MLGRMSDETGMDPEDRKILTLARAARARNEVPEGAAVRDETGRTYVAGTVALPSLRLSALQTAVAMAVASGARRWRPRPSSPRPASRRRGPAPRARPGRTGHPGPARRPGRHLQATVTAG